MSGRVTLRIVEGPDYRRDADGWEHHAYVVELRYQGRKMRSPWRQGLGITDDPDAASVLESLFLDSCAFDNARGFEDWAADYGYDVDSRKAYAIWQDVGKLAGRLARLFAVSDAERAPWMDRDAEELAREVAS